MAQRDKHGLTKAWRMFCDEYRTNGHNATQAYKTAYPKSTTKTGEANGHKLLRKAEIRTYLNAKDEMAEKVADITEERIKLELARIGFLDVRKLYDEKGQLIPIHKLDDDTAAAVSGVRYARQYTGTDKKGNHKYIHVQEYKTVSKKSALKMLGQNKKMFTDKLELEGSGLVISISK